MAIAGSGGWKPSILVVVRNGQVVTLGLTHNKPRELVCMDVEEAVDRLLTDPHKPVSIYFYGTFYRQVKTIVEKEIQRN